MAIYSKESLENLRQRIDLVDVLNSHIELKRAGSAYKGLCPFHDEKTPSFMIQKGDRHYHCFGCGAHGDAIQFMMTYLRMSFGEAVESLAEKFHVPLEQVEGEEQYKGPSKTSIREALEEACRLYQFYLLHTEEGHEALRYLYSRGIDLDFVKKFRLGLAPKAPGIFRKVMQEKKITDAVMEAAGLIAPSNRGGYRDFFYDRITFPIHQASGAIIGFSARKYHEETFGGKYVNTPETPLFKKSRVLFGLNYSRRRIAKERKAIIVEGQIDALRLVHEGLNLAVAGQGTAFGEGHVKELLNLGVNQVYLAMDSDDAGREAASKIGDFFQREGVEVHCVHMPPGSDPDSFLREKGSDAFLKMLEQSTDYLTFIVDYHSRFLNVQTPAGKNELAHLVAQQVRKWKHQLMVHESLKKLASMLQVPEDVIGVGMQYMPNTLIRKSASIGLQTIDPDKILESDFLRWLLAQPSFLEIAKHNLPPEKLKNEACSRIYQTYLADPGSDLLALIKEPEDQALISELMDKRINHDRAEEHFIETIQKILDRNWMEHREEVRRKIQSGTLSDDEAMELTKEFDSLKKNQPKVGK